MNQTKPGKKSGVLAKLLILPPLVRLLLTVAITAAAVVLIMLGVGNPLASEQKTTRLGFEDMGELATQAAYCTEVNVTEASRELFGVTIPFTQSKYIYSYDVVVKAGFDFGAVTYSVDEANKTIQVELPPVRILSSELDLDSFRLYHEAESIFRPITLEENNQALAALKQAAEENAVANGLLEQARANAETILNGFFGQAYDLDEYEIQYTGAAA